MEMISNPQLDKIRILSSACGAIFMPGFFKCLKNNHEREITIIGTDIEDGLFMNSIVDKYYKVPRYDDINYVETLLNICQKEKINIFFPHISMELDLIRENIDLFEKIGVKVAVSKENSLKIANNKYDLYEFLRKIGVQVPEYYLIKNKEDLLFAAHKLGYPNKDICVKVAESSGSRGIRIITKKKRKSSIFLTEKPCSLYITLEAMCEIIDDFDVFPVMIAMTALPGCEYTVDLLADHGKVLYIAGRRNYVSLMSIAQESVTEIKEDAFELCRNIVECLNLDGNIGFDFMLDENDSPVLTDLNPRITATIVLYEGAGINFPYLRVKQLLGEKLPSEIEVKTGIRLIRKYEDIIIDSNGMKIIS